MHSRSPTINVWLLIYCLCSLSLTDSPSILLVVAGISTIIGLMIILLLLTLYLKRKRRNSDEENTTLAGSQNQENEQNCTACSTSGTSGENIQFSSVSENMETRKQSLSEQELVTPCRDNERKRTQSLGAFTRENLAPVVEWRSGYQALTDQKTTDVSNHFQRSWKFYQLTLSLEVKSHASHNVMWCGFN